MKFIFIGNRINVLKKMIELKCEIVEIFAVKESFLERELKILNIPYKRIENKVNLVEAIINTEFDCLVSNGCPYILPVSKIKKINQKFINIHPSLLPDLKGKHPINGALLFERRHGVTCHHMDDGIDTGDIISNIEIPLDSQIELQLLYQLSFKAEAEVFYKAFMSDFKCIDVIQINDKPIYYTREEKDLIITYKDDLKTIIRKIRAFGIPSLGVKFIRNKIEYKILSATIVSKVEINNLFEKSKINEIVIIYDNNVVVKYSKNIIQFKLDTIRELNVGENFFEFEVKESE